MSSATPVADSLTQEKIREAFDKVKDDFTVDGGVLKLITEDRFPEASDIMGYHFTPDEPLSNGFGVEWEPEWQQMVGEILKENLSVMMVSTDTNELMGIRLNGVMKRSDNPDLSLIQYEPIRELFIFLTRKDTVDGFFNKFGVDEAMHFFSLGVNRKYRRRGLGTKLMAASIALSKELGFKAIKGEGTSTFSQRIYDKHEFEQLYELKYDEYIYKGHPLSDGTGEHKCTKIYGKKI